MLNTYSIIYQMQKLETEWKEMFSIYKLVRLLPHHKLYWSYLETVYPLDFGIKITILLINIGKCFLMYWLGIDLDLFILL